MSQVMIGGTLLFIVLIIFIICIIAINYSHSKRRENEYYDKLLKENFKKHLLQAKLEIQERTCDNLSRELHDNVGQLLVLAKIQMEMFLNKQTEDLHLLREAKEVIDNALTDLKSISKGLNSEYVSNILLEESINDMLSRVDRSGFISTVFTIMGEEKETDGHIKLLVFRIIQEIVQNVLKHANAKRIEVSLKYEPTLIALRISDNGIGFNQSIKQDSKGLGLHNMAKRAELFGGSLNIKSSIGQGTVLELSVPYKHKP